MVSWKPVEERNNTKWFSSFPEIVISKESDIQTWYKCFFMK